MKTTALTGTQGRVRCQTVANTFVKNDHSSVQRKEAARLSELQGVTQREKEMFRISNLGTSNVTVGFCVKVDNVLTF